MCTEQKIDEEKNLFLTINFFWTNVVDLFSRWIPALRSAVCSSCHILAFSCYSLFYDVVLYYCMYVP